MLFSDGGKAVRFDEDDVRPMGRTARGVRGMRLPRTASSVICHAGGRRTRRRRVLTATENGYGKRTPIAEYTRHGRGTKGMIAIQAVERNGKLVARRAGATTDDEVMLISDRRRADPHRGGADPRAWAARRRA